METLIELYGERAIENIIGPEIFMPKRVVYLCLPEVAQDKAKQNILRNFFAHRGLSFEIEFIESSFYRTDKILTQLRKIKNKYPDCALDVTGGTDAALIAAGMFCSEANVPTFTYSRKKNCFYDISQASFAENIPCKLNYIVEDFFLMTGGILREGRVDNNILTNYEDSYEAFFNVFLRHRKSWPAAVSFFQKASRGNDPYAPLKTTAPYYKNENHPDTPAVNLDLLRGLEKIGYLTNLHIEEGKTIQFSFADHQRRVWLRDVGSVLELYMYHICKQAAIFNDVISSAIVDWDSSMGNKSIRNEIDVVATRGVVPLFISCKACDIKTVALNELAIIKDRFGGKGAKAVIVTTEHCNSMARHRAAQLGIAVIDIEEFETGDIEERIKIIMKATPESS